MIRASLRAAIARFQVRLFGGIVRHVAARFAPSGRVDAGGRGRTGGRRTRPGQGRLSGRVQPIDRAGQGSPRSKRDGNSSQLRAVLRAAKELALLGGPSSGAVCSGRRRESELSTPFAARGDGPSSHRRLCSFFSVFNIRKRLMSFSRATVVCALLGLILPSLASDRAGGNCRFWRWQRVAVESWRAGTPASISGQQLTVTTAGSNDSYNNAILHHIAVDRPFHRQIYLQQQSWRRWRNVSHRK